MCEFVYKVKWYNIRARFLIFVRWHVIRTNRHINHKREYNNNARENRTNVANTKCRFWIIFLSLYLFIYIQYIRVKLYEHTTVIRSSPISSNYEIRHRSCLDDLAMIKIGSDLRKKIQDREIILIRTSISWTGIKN